MKSNLDLKKLNGFVVSPSQHAERTTNNRESGNNFLNSINDSVIDNVSDSSFVIDYNLGHVVYSFDKRYANMPNGPANDLEHSACGLYLAYHIVRNFYNYDIDFLELKEIMLNNNYRQWNFPELRNSKGNRITMCDPNLDLYKIKSKDPSNEELQNCSSVEEVIKKFGNPNGIGISAFFLDNIINFLNGNSYRIAKDTRVQSLNELFRILKSGVPVPIRVSNSIYHDDPNRKEGHYVTIIGIDKGNFVILDTSEKELVIKPISKIITAITDNPNLIFVWNLSPDMNKR